MLRILNHFGKKVKLLSGKSHDDNTIKQEDWKQHFEKLFNNENETKHGLTFQIVTGNLIGFA